MKYLVRFIQVSEHPVHAIVDAENPEDAMKKAREGDNTEEFDQGLPESYELKRFSCSEMTDEDAKIWISCQKTLNEDL